MNEEDLVVDVKKHEVLGKVSEIHQVKDNYMTLRYTGFIDFNGNKLYELDQVKALFDKEVGIIFFNDIRNDWEVYYTRDYLPSKYFSSVKRLRNFYDKTN